jgi:hypothetical protein
MVIPIQTHLFTQIRSIGVLLALSLCSCLPIKAGKIALNIEGAQENTWMKLHWEKECIQLLPGGTQLLSAGESCISQPIDLPPGHYEMRVRSSSPPESLRTLTILPYIISSDSGGTPVLIPIEAKHPKKRGTPSIFSVRFFGSSSSNSFLLYPPPYPFDGGWLPETPAGFRFELKNDTDLSFEEIEIRRSKFNIPLIDRIPNTTRTFELGGELKEIAVNLQGSSADQLNEVRKARSSWKPSGPVIIVSQIAPEDSTHDGVSTGSLQVLEELRNWSEQSSQIRFGVSVNPYLNNHHNRLETRFFDTSTYEQVKRALLPFLANKVDLVLLRTDDFTPSIGSTPYDYGLTNQHDRSFFKTLAKAHLALINDIQKLISKESPDTRLAFVPPWYATSFVHNSPKLGSEYLKELSSHLEKSIPIVWTGPVVRSLWIDDDSLGEFRKLTLNHPLILWDNTPYARAHKDFWIQDTERVLGCSLLEPYDIPISTQFFSSNLSPQILVNTGINPVNRIQLETTQRYVSNPSEYDPEETLLAILLSRFGDEYATLLLEFDRTFWSAYKNLKDNNTAGLRLDKATLTSILGEMDTFVTSEAKSTTEKLKALFFTGLKE